MKATMTPGRWKVPQDLSGGDDWANGVTVIGGLNGRTLIADCRGTVSRAEQLANARAIAALPELIETIRECERYLGDRPSSDREARALHQAVVMLMGRGLR